MLNVELGDNLETVTARISEAVEWCVHRADSSQPKACLRSPELMSHPLAPGRKWIVSSVHVKRFLALGRPNLKPAGDLAGGRLLAYEPDVNLFMGLEEDETHGYFDHDNVPPWDTWIAYIYEPKRDYLVSWVAPEFISLVASGIAVSDDSIKWLDDSDFVLAGELRRRGIV